MSDYAPVRNVSSDGPLHGVRVLDFTRVLSGPHTTRMLCDLGADVVKIEPPEGDLTRYSAPRINSMASYYAQQNTGKKAVSIDLSVDGAIDLVKQLVQHADVLVENFRPGVMSRFGLGQKELRALNPRLIYASISGYGATGPWVDRRAYAAVVGAESGFTLAQAAPLNLEPVNDPHSHADIYTSIECASAILAALYQREHTGFGQWIDVSMAQTMLYVNEHAHNQLWDGPTDPDWIRSFQAGEYPILTLADGSRAVVSGHPAEDGTFNRYVRAMNRFDLTHDAKFASVETRLHNLSELLEIIHSWALTITDFEQFQSIAASLGLAVGRLRTTREIADTDWAQARDAIVEVSDRGTGTIRVPNAPWKFSDSTTGVTGMPRYRGEDNREVLISWLGVPDITVETLTNKGILVSRVPDLQQ